MSLVSTEQQKLREFILEQTRDQRTQLVDYVRQQQVFGIDMTLMGR